MGNWGSWEVWGRLGDGEEGWNLEIRTHGVLKGELIRTHVRSSWSFFVFKIIVKERPPQTLPEPKPGVFQIGLQEPSKRLASRFALSIEMNTQPVSKEARWQKTGKNLASRNKHIWISAWKAQTMCATVRKLSKLAC